MKNLIIIFAASIITISNALAQLTRNYEVEEYSVGLMIGPQIPDGVRTPDSINLTQSPFGTAIGAYFRYNIPKIQTFVRAEGLRTTHKLRLKNQDDEKLEFDQQCLELSALAGVYFGPKRINFQIFGGASFNLPVATKFKPSNQVFTITSKNESLFVPQLKAGIGFDRAPMCFTLSFKQDLATRSAVSLVPAYTFSDNERGSYRLTFIELTFGMYL